MLAPYSRRSPSEQIALLMRRGTQSTNSRSIRASLLRIQRQGTTINRLQADEEDSSDNDDILPGLLEAADMDGNEEKRN